MRSKKLILLCSLLITFSCARKDFSSLENNTSESEYEVFEAKRVETSLLKIFANGIDEENIKNSKLIQENSENNISISDIQQGLRPVCYFLSALAGLAYHRPDDVKKLVTENEDGTFTVVFPGLPKGKNTITVDRPSEAEMSLYIYKGKGTDAIWAPVAVKAIAKYWSKNGILRFFKQKTDAANWGGAWEGIEIVTGHIADIDLISLHSNDKILEKVEKAFSNKKLVSISTFGKGNLHPKNVGDIIFSKAHVMTVINFDKQQKTLTIRDPYGKIKRLGNNNTVVLDDSTDGVFTMKLDELKKYFTDMSFETDKNTNFISRLKYIK
ncbi:MAG: C2 family cysteine protease [Candidatus Sericytochromatia bacterium]